MSSNDFLSWDEMATGCLSCSDFETGPRILTIRTLVIEQVMKISNNGNPIPVKENGKQVYENGEPVMQKEEKRVMHFYETGAGLIINKCNKELLKKMFGLPTTNWKDKRIALYAAPNCKTATSKSPAQPGLRVYGSPDLDKTLEVTTGLRPQPDRVWRLEKMEEPGKAAPPNKPKPLPPLDTILDAIPRGVAKLTPETLAAVRAPFKIEDSTDLTKCPEGLIRNYYKALAEAVKGA